MQTYDDYTAYLNARLARYTRQQSATFARRVARALAADLPDPTFATVDPYLRPHLCALYEEISEGSWRLTHIGDALNALAEEGGVPDGNILAFHNALEYWYNIHDPASDHRAEAAACADQYMAQADLNISGDPPDDAHWLTHPAINAAFRRLLGNGSDFGIRLQYAVQPSPDGLAQAFIIGEEFIGSDNVCLVLGDNIFYGQSFTQTLQQAAAQTHGATVFAYQVKDPERFGVVEFDQHLKALSIEEKPTQPKSNWAVTGLYFYDKRVVEFAKQIKPSARGELEISDLNQLYLEDGSLSVQLLGRGFAWLDTGTHESLHEAASFVRTIQNVQALQVACLEEIAWRNGWLSNEQLADLAKPMTKNQYGQYLLRLLKK